MANPPLHSPINPHFFQPLIPGFTNHLDIPVAFFLNYIVGSNKGNTAELRSDASKTTWKVKLDGRRLSNGWEDFTIAHDLRVGDIVVFRHEGDLVFHVSPLGPSGCEILYGQDNSEDDQIEELSDTEKVSRKKKSLKQEADLTPDNSLDNSCFVVTVTASNLKRDTVYLPKEFALSNTLMNNSQIVLMNEEGESWTIDFRHEPYASRFYMRKGWRSFCVANGKTPGDFFTFKLVQREGTPVLKLVPLDSEDLDKSDTEKVPRKNCPEMEAQYSSDDPFCFVATITASNLSRDRLYLPKLFVTTNDLMKKTQIVLMNEEGESMTIHSKLEPYSGRFYMRGGWNTFCVANGKKPGDLLAFKLIRNEEKPVLQLVPLDGEDMHELDPSNNTRQGNCLKATKKEFLGEEDNPNDARQGNSSKGNRKEYISSAEPTNDHTRQRKCTKTIKKERVSTSRNRFVTLTSKSTRFKICRLNLPLEFTMENGLNKAGNITMLDRYGARWPISMLKDRHKRGAMCLGRGIKGFCEVNGVKMFESFVLELIWEDTVPVLKFSSKV